MTSTPSLPARRRLASMAAAVALLVAACGGGDQSELSTIDADLPGADERTEVAAPDTNDDEPLELDTIEDPNDDDDEVAEPEAVLPPPPAPESSPAERQRLQELGLREADLVQPERLPTPEEDLDDASNPANARPAPEPPRVLDNPELYPDTIPAIVPGAPDPRNPADDLFAVPELPAPPVEFGNVDPEGSAETAATLDGTDQTFGVDPLSDVVDPVAPDLSVPETVTDEFDDPLSDPDSFVPLDDGLPAPVNEPRESDCEARPWERGCDGPPPDRPSSDGTGSGGSDVFVDPDGDNETEAIDPSTDAIQDEGEGVDVPQDIIDILLTPGDNDRPADDGDASVAGTGASPDDAATVNPAGG